MMSRSQSSKRPSASMAGMSRRRQRSWGLRARHSTGAWRSMASKSFRLNTIARVIALGASLFVLFYLFSQTTLYATATVVALVILYQIYELIRHVERTNFELSRFLRSIRYADFSQTFSSRGRGSSFDAL